MSQESAVDDGMAAEILNRLLIKIEGLEKRKTKIISLIRRSFGWAAACAILGLAGFYLFRASEKPGSSDIKIVRAKTNPVLQKEITNNTAVSMEILLPDRSVVQLFPNSKLSYDESFSAHARNLRLEGKAFFKVAKDRQKPFTVFAEHFATTALGTQFMINSNEKNKMLVRLYEGKVVIRSSVRNLPALNDVYLIPGQSFTADIPSNRFVVASFLMTKAPPAPKNRLIQNDRDSELKFDNERLVSVFEKLNNKYHARIKYTLSELEGLYFTGSVLKTDSLKAILSILSNMNGLEFREGDDGILIQKQK